VFALDTNVLVRLLLGDDRAQHGRARRQVEAAIQGGQRLLISLPVLMETVWVLRSRYQLGKPVLQTLLSGLLESMELAIEDEEAVEEALYFWQTSSAEFTDCLLAAHHRRLGCEATLTFDAKAGRVSGFLRI